jgi:type IV pilus biogenesis protein CpaD/CtpE
MGFARIPRVHRCGRASTPLVTHCTEESMRYRHPQPPILLLVALAAASLLQACNKPTITGIEIPTEATWNEIVVPISLDHVPDHSEISIETSDSKLNVAPYAGLS